MASGENPPFRSLVLSIPGHQAKSTLCAFVWKQLGGEELFVWYYRKLSWCACGGARLSGNELEFRVTAFCSRWERICLITCGSSILAMTLTAPPHASQVDISISPKAPTYGEYSFQALCFYALGCSSWRHAAPQAIAHRRLSGVWRSCLVSTASPVPTGHKGSVFAIGLMRHSDEHAMEACQIGSRPGYQGCQACDKVQWFEDDVGSTVAVRCIQLIVNIAARA